MLDLAVALPQGFHSRGVIHAVSSFSSSPSPLFASLSLERRHHLPLAAGLYH
jgi:hypothetical protein